MGERERERGLQPMSRACRAWRGDCQLIFTSSFSHRYSLMSETVAGERERERASSLSVASGDVRQL